MNKSNIIRELEKEKARMLSIVQEADKRLCDAPEGNVRIIRHGKGHQYYLRMKGSDKSGVYLPVSEREKAEALIRKGYDLKVRAAAQKQYQAVERFLKSYEPDVLKKIYEAQSDVKRKCLQPVEVSDPEYIRQWLSYEYDRKPFIEDTPEHFSSKGERVRSKSEAMIADALSREGIPYRYECPLCLGETIIHPDFTILRPSDREILYWEHLGMMDDPEYLLNALRRIRLYEQHGLYPGIHLILTMETKALPVNLTVIRRMIQAYCA